MGIGEFLKALFGGEPPGGTPPKPVEVKFEKRKALGSHAASKRAVAVITMLNEVRQYMAEHLQPFVEEAGYEYEDHPSINRVIESRIVVLEALPQTDAKLHAKYDKLLRMKKAMGKTHDVLCLIALRGNFKKYPRGTYPQLQYFCVKPDDLGHREPDLPPEGMETIEGPTLYNLCDIGAVITAKIKEMSVAHLKKSP